MDGQIDFVNTAEIDSRNQMERLRKQKRIGATREATSIETKVIGVGPCCTAGRPGATAAALLNDEVSHAPDAHAVGAEPRRAGGPCVPKSRVIAGSPDRVTAGPGCTRLPV